MHFQIALTSEHVAGFGTSVERDQKVADEKRQKIEEEEKKEEYGKSRRQCRAT